MENEILVLLFESLKIQATRYKEIMDSSSLTHEQRKEFDSEIKQMYNLLAEMTNSSTVYSLAELNALKVQFQNKYNEFENLVNNFDFTAIELTPEQIESIKGQDGNSFTYEDFTPEQLESFKGQDGNSFTYEDFTPEQLELFKGKDGISFTYEDFTPEQLELLKGEKGDLFTYEELTEEQKESLRGEKGLSAYGVALENGFIGSEEEWLATFGSSSSPADLTIGDINGLESTLDSITRGNTLWTEVDKGRNLYYSGVFQSYNLGTFQGNINELKGKMEWVMKTLNGEDVFDDDDEFVENKPGLRDRIQELFERLAVLESTFNNEPIVT